MKKIDEAAIARRRQLVKETAETAAGTRPRTVVPHDIAVNDYAILIAVGRARLRHKAQKDPLRAAAGLQSCDEIERAFVAKGRITQVEIGTSYGTNYGATFTAADWALPQLRDTPVA